MKKRNRFFAALLSLVMMICMTPASVAQNVDCSENGLAHTWGTTDWMDYGQCGSVDGVRVCTRCGAEETVTKYREHDWGSWKVVKKATNCLEWDGLKEKTCRRCGETTQDETTGDHAWGGWKTVKKATCTKTGKRERSCSVCGKTQTETVSKADHTWSRWQTVVSATCSENGSETRSCTQCGRKQTCSSEMLPHTYGEWTVIREALEGRPGLRESTCRVCGFFTQEVYYPENTLLRDGANDEEQVKKLQEALNEAGHDCGEADGIFGVKTEAAVREYQKKNGLQPDGIAWPGLLLGLNVVQNNAIEITEVDEPVADRQPEPDGRILTDGFSFASGSHIRWYHNGARMDEEERFVLGDVYTVKLLLRGNAYDASELTATVNGAEASVSVMAGIITVSCDFVCAAPEGGMMLMSGWDLPALPLHLDAAGLSEPSFDSLPDDSAELSGEFAAWFYIPPKGIQWQWLENGEWTTAESDRRFPNGATEYKVTVTVCPNRPFEAENYRMTASVNGEAAEICRSDSAENAFEISRTFRYVVDRLEITGLESPFPGEMLDKNVSVRVHTSGDGRWHEYPGEVTGYNVRSLDGGESTVIVSGECEINNSYEAILEIQPRGMILDVSNALVDGKTIAAVANPAAGSVVIRVEFPPIEEHSIPITRLDLTVSEPADGAAASRSDNALRMRSGGRTLEREFVPEYIEWYNADTGELHPWGEAFEAGGHYRIEGDVYAPYGYGFMEGAEAFVNGNPATIQVYNPIRARIEYDFTPEPAAFTSASVKTGIGVGKSAGAPEAEGYTDRGSYAAIGVTSYQWTDLATGAAMADGAVFEANGRYRLTVGLDAPVNFVFADSLKVAFDQTVKTVTPFAGNRAKIVTSVEFELPEDDSVDISSIRIDLAEPEAGASPDYGRNFSACTAEGMPVDDISVLSMYWLDETGGVLLKPESVFEPGHRYLFRASFIVAEGYDFADDFSASVNGNAAQVSVSENAVRARSVEYAFEVPAKLTEVYRIYVDNLLLPAPGMHPVTNLSVTADDEEGNPAEVISKRVFWSSEEDADFAGNSGVFADGKMYTLTIDLETGSGSIFPEGMVYPRINGDASGPQPSAADKKLTLSFRFRCAPQDIAYISNVNVNAEVPVEGQYPDFAPSVSATDTAGNGAAHTVRSVEWYDMTDGSAMSASDAFVGGRRYKLCVRVGFGDTMKLIPFGFTTSLNGAMYSDYGSAHLDSENSIEADFEFECLPAVQKREISRVAIGVDVPAAGNTPDVTPGLQAFCTDGTAGTVSLSAAAWEDVTDTAAPAPMAQGEAFLPGHRYHIEVTVSAMDGLCFREEAAATFNGNYVGLSQNPDRTVGEASYFFTVSELPEGTEPELPEGTEPGLPEGSEPELPEGTEPESPEGTEPELPGGTVPESPEGTEPENPEGTEPELPEGTVPESPEGTEPENPEGTESVKPEAAKPEKPVNGKPDQGGKTEADGKTETDSRTDGDGKQLRLTIPGSCLDDYVYRSEKENALELYGAQLAGEVSDTALKLAKDCTAECGNQIVYIPDMSDRGVYRLFEDMPQATDEDLRKLQILYGAEGAQEEYEFIAILRTPASGRESAPCNMADISAPELFAMYTAYVYAQAVRTVVPDAVPEDELLTLIAWNENTQIDWFMIVARKK